MSDAWYLDAGSYYVPTAERDGYPLRQGDLIAAPEGGGEGWLAAQVVHPTCELTKGAVKQVQVARVRPLGDAPDDFSRSLLVAGFREKEGRRQVAMAHTFFLPPWEEGGEPCFTSFREIECLPRAEVVPARRLVAITHECRVTFIRRWLYFRFRLAFSYEQVRGWEAVRIAADPVFAGPRPDWAPAPA